MARDAGAVLAVNAGYFVMHARDGLPGVPAGIGVYDGRLESLATNGRAALLLLGDRPRVARLTTELTVAAGGRRGDRRREPDARPHPQLRRRGRRPPTEEPRHDVTCTDPSEVVLFTPALGRKTRPGTASRSCSTATAG